MFDNINSNLANKLNSKSSLSKRLVLLFFIGFLFLFHHYGYIGHYGFDDMQYAELAHNLLNGEVDFEDHFSFRFTIILFTALSYLIFGVNDFASSIPSILVSCSILIMVYRVVKNELFSVVLIALGLTSFCSWLLTYSDKLMPDIFLTATVMFSFYLFHKYRFVRKGIGPIQYGFLFSFSLMLGFCSKGTVVLIIPWLVYLIISDFRKQKDWTFWISAILSGIVLLTLYFILIYSLTGDAGQRFESIASNAYLNRCSYDSQSIRILLKRIFLELPKLFMREGMIISFLFVLPVFLSNLLQKRNRLNPEHSFIINSSIILLLASNFMSISATSYVPMCLDPRHFLFFIPIAAIAASYSISELLKNRLSFILFVVVSAIVIVFMIFENSDTYWKLYLPILVLMSFFKVLTTLKLKIVLSTLILLICFYPIYELFQYSKKLGYNEQRDLIYKEVLSIKEPSYVISNKVQTRICRYYQEFNPNHPVKFLSYNSFNTDTLNDLPIYLLENEHTRSLMQLEKNDLPFYVRYKSNDDFEIFGDSNLGITFTQLDEIRNPISNAKPIINSLNDFERSYKDWKQDDKFIFTELSKSGKKAYHCPQYSSTYILTLNENIINSLDQALYVEAKVMVWTADKTEASLVISIENETGSYIYETTRINKHIGSYSNWWEVDLNTFVKKSGLQKDSKIKIYLYNPDQNTIYIDDFSISIMSI